MRRMLRLAVIVLPLCAIACQPSEDRVGADLQQILLGTPPFVQHSARRLASWKQTQQFYQRHGLEAVWTDRGRPTGRMDQLLSTIERATEHGLEPLEYGYAELSRARQATRGKWFGDRVEEERVAELDSRLTYAFLCVASDLLYGRLSPAQVHGKVVAAREEVDLLALLDQAIVSSNVTASLAALLPRTPQYAGLQQALEQYRARLSQGSAQSDTDAAWRVRQIEMNLDRWRWKPRDLGEKHILVNIPGYELQVVDHDRPVLAMRVIVGAPDTPTPVFSDQMVYVVFSPYWNIPESILRDETLPRAMADPEYLDRAGIEVVRASGGTPEPVDPSTIDWSVDPAAQGLRLRQIPGPENALGLVKFLFPNHFSVYLHDTPGDALFARTRRALSHGCIRVEKPVALAEAVLNGRRSWSRERILRAMHEEQENVVRLPAPLDVHLGYWTAWVQPDGSVVFTDDPYGLDRKHDAALRRLRDADRPESNRAQTEG